MAVKKRISEDWFSLFYEFIILPFSTVLTPSSHASNVLPLPPPSVNKHTAGWCTPQNLFHSSLLPALQAFFPLLLSSFIFSAARAYNNKNGKTQKKAISGILFWGIHDHIFSLKKMPPLEMLKRCSPLIWLKTNTMGRMMLK